MHRSAMREFLKGEIPDINYGLIKEKTSQRIAGYEKRQSLQEFYFAPKLAMGLLVILLTINVYGLVQEILYNLGMRGHGVSRILTLPYSSPAFLFKAIAVFADNLLAIVVTLSLILLLDKHFFGLYKIYRFMKGNVIAAKNVMVKIPTVAVALFRRS